MTIKQRLGAALIPRLPITRFLFDLIRFELVAGRVRLVNGWLPSRRARLRQTRAMRGLYANVGCGPQVLPDFVNLDLQAASTEVLEWDCRRELPLASGSAAGIRVEHFLEHLETRQELPSFLADCRRCLRPGGVLRIIVPDAARYLEAYCRGDLGGFRELGVPDPLPLDLPTRMDVVNHVFHQWHEHRWGYDLETLEDRLRRAGFGRVERTSFRSSLDDRLAADLEEHALYSLYVDAVA